MPKTKQSGLFFKLDEDHGEQAEVVATSDDGFADLSNGFTAVQIWVSGDAPPTRNALVPHADVEAFQALRRDADE